MLDKLRLILYLILIFIGLIALLYIAPIFFIVSIIILWMGIKDLDKRENKKDYDINKKLSSLNNKERVESCTLKYENELTTVDIYSEENNQNIYHTRSDLFKIHNLIQFIYVFQNINIMTVLATITISFPYFFSLFNPSFAFRLTVFDT